jgi:hypothetical protein
MQEAVQRQTVIKDSKETLAVEENVKAVVAAVVAQPVVDMITSFSRFSFFFVSYSLAFKSL